MSGTKLWKNKIKGLRGKATGLVFVNFDRKKHVITKEEAKSYLNINKNLYLDEKNYVSNKQYNG